jgi:putative ABC transport system substrate-binding protein
LGLAADLVRLNVDVIVSNTNPETLAAQQATASIPIVMLFGLDPVGTRLIASFARPGGNVTGVVWATPETAAKTVQLLKEMVPTARKVAVIYDPHALGAESYIVANEGAARSLGMTRQRVEVRGPEDFEVAFATILKGRADSLWVGTTGVVGSRIAEILDFAVRHRLPAIYPNRWVVDLGGLMSYGPKYVDVFRRAAFYVDRLLRGAKPADLPVEQPSTYELVINLKTAKALGLTIPQSLLVRADEIIQ